nr:cyclic nucleotide-binding domain-containing protein [Candidatus Gracilibacteria bacterium]
MTSMLDSLDVLSSLTQQDRDNLAIFCQERHVSKGEILFSEGDDANSMYFLKTGKFNIFKTLNGGQVKLGQVVAEEILGEMALFQSTNSTRMATAIAEEDSILVVILNFSMEELKQKHPKVIEKIKQIIEYRNMQNKYISK